MTIARRLFEMHLCQIIPLVDQRPNNRSILYGVCTIGVTAMGWTYTILSERCAVIIARPQLELVQLVTIDRGGVQ